MCRLAGFQRKGMMHHFSYDDFVRLGIADKWPDDMPKNGSKPIPHATSIATTSEKPTSRFKAPKLNDAGQNKTEALFDRVLFEQRELYRNDAGGLVIDYAFEPFNLRLAGRCHLRIDFGVWLAPHNQLVVIDVKGFMEEDAAVKLKTAAEKFPRLPFYVVYRGRKNKGWEFKAVNRSGIVPCSGAFLGL